MATKMGTSKKEVSVGEFDERTGLTYITLQRGRLINNMGPPSTKRATVVATGTESARDRAVPADDEELPPGDGVGAQEATAPHAPRPPPRPQRVFCSGVFTGRSLFAEEVVYLVQRGALVVYAMEELAGSDATHHALSGATDDAPQRDREPLSLAQLIARVVGNRHASPAALDVYAFLKDNKLHPRRPTPPPPTEERDPALERGRHETTAHLLLFDVFKTITETQYVPVETTTVPRPTGDESRVVELPHEPVVSKMRKRKVKRLAMIFRVAVSAFRDGSLRPRELRRLMGELAKRRHEEHQGNGQDEIVGESAQREIVPLKLAVADVDRSVLLFEVA